MALDVLVLHSPLLPELAYAPLLAAFEELGHSPALAGVGSPRLIVAHSNAGYVAPSVRVPGIGTPVVFVDAALPPEHGTTRRAPARFLEFLRTLDRSPDGLLPPWTRWWPREQVDRVLPRELFDRIDAVCPRLPLGYFTTEVTAPVGWVAEPNAYLAFGETYAEETARARDHGWPVEVTEGHHLHFLFDPDGVAEAVLRLGEHARSPG